MKEHSVFENERLHLIFIICVACRQAYFEAIKIPRVLGFPVKWFWEDSNCWVAWRRSVDELSIQRKQLVLYALYYSVNERGLRKVEDTEQGALSVTKEQQNAKDASDSGYWLLEADWEPPEPSQISCLHNM